MFTDFKHVAAILKQVIESFRASHAGKLPRFEIATFFLLPAVFAYVLCRFADDHEKLGGDLLVVLSIYLGFLITMLVPFFNLIDRVGKPDSSTTSKFTRDPHKENRLALYRVLYSQIAFAILLSVGALISIIMAKQLGKSMLTWKMEIKELTFNPGTYLLNLLRFIGYYCVALGALNLVKILIGANALIASDLPKK